MATKKKYYFSLSKPGRSTSGGRLFTADVYIMKRNTPIHIGTTHKWNTASSKGDLHEIYDFLFKKKLVSKREFDQNRGYYRHSSSKIEIFWL